MAALTSRSLVLIFVLLGAAATRAADMDEIYHYHRIDDRLATAGQITPAQVPSLRDAGVGLVINLAVADAERNAGEGDAVVGAGMAYVQIPVDWNAPSLADVQLFFDVMDARNGRRTLVHCFANYRASAFTYLYRTLRAGVPEAEARADLEALWTDDIKAEYPHWMPFIERVRAHYQR